MAIRDLHGLPLTGASTDSVAHYEKARQSLRCFVGDPVADADAAINADAGFVMAHILKGYLHGLSMDGAAAPVTKSCADMAMSLMATPREQGHATALAHLSEGRWHLAGETLADLTVEYPHDALALQIGHQIDFFTGNAPMLRDRIAKALPEWATEMSGYHALLGMHAFGLEETGDYASAETAGKRAVELEPRDGWAQHAVAHVMEMQSRQSDGIAWMRADTDSWTRESFLQIHNWWHLALFHFDLGEVGEVLSLYDGPIDGGRSPIALNMVDASAILWRLHLTGEDCGERWGALADLWQKQAGGLVSAFNDVHAMMAFVGAGRYAAAEELIRSMRDAVEGKSDNAGFVRDVGLPVASGILAFGNGDHTEAVRVLSPVRAIAHRFGGSHAQRDAIDLTLVEAALRAGEPAVARELTAERLHARPASPLSQLFCDRAAALPD